MDNSLSFKHLSKPSSLNFNSILRQYILDLMASFLEFKFVNPKFCQKQIAK